MYRRADRPAATTLPERPRELFDRLLAHKKVLWSIGALSVFSIWLLCRPYLGLDHDARIYIGRAVADLDPTGVGLELPYVHDGQSKFSAFPMLIRPLVRILGPGQASMCLTFVGLSVWIGSASNLLARFYQGRVLWASLICLATLPAWYGGFAIFRWGEQYATPRVFSEAAGFVALACLLERRRLAASVCLALAALLHPIMAIPVVVAAIVLLGLTEWRWFLVLAALGGTGLAAAMVGAPIADRLFLVMDPAWDGVVANLQPHLFPREWLEPAWALLVLQVGSAAMASTLSNALLRRVLLAVIAVSVAGILMAAIGPSLLIVQLQVWRAQWLLSFLAAASFAPTAIELWRRGGAERSALAMLVIAWVGRESLGTVLFGLSTALALRFATLPAIMSRISAIAAWSLATLFSAAMIGIPTTAMLLANGDRPLGEWINADVILRLPWPSILPVLLALAVCSFPWAEQRLARLAALLLVTCLLIGSLLAWDARTQFSRAKEAQIGAQGLRSAIPSGTIYWPGDNATSWLWTGRPEWFDVYLASGVAFDRSLAIEWHRRFETLVKTGFLREDDRFGFQAETRPPLIATPAAIHGLCGTAGGPDWVVMPVSRASSALLSTSDGFWRAPAPSYERGYGSHKWISVQSYAIFACEAQRRSRAIHEN